ncbi:MAG: SHOCT domain-containing protein [Spirochaetaceae bacterium]|jgi:putative membrane protein|nr:SHOCT domain-containing protein [Spirochaetaceae bacterium]
MMNGWGFGNGMNWGGGIVSILVLAGLIIGGFFFVKWMRKNTDKDRFSDNQLEALELLKTRYASGEITSEEFLKIKSDLEDLQK